jgi:hypothetical protein
VQQLKSFSSSSSLLSFILAGSQSVRGNFSPPKANDVIYVIQCEQSDAFVVSTSTIIICIELRTIYMR